ncbi:hypothetical protein B0H14DRAFT_2802887 [Mycena olivaceomarginata]|nr:hypothetical protein B0H14DRAFT_2802887 [Mycena olivaceomarginata]
MVFTPQELVDAIIEELHDLPSLKACCLVGSTFRPPSQRILLSSLTLQPESYNAARIFLQESPHVNISSTDVEDFLRVLSQLTNVRICILDARLSHTRWNKQLSVQLSVGIPQFLTRQPLRELHVNSVSGIPTLAFFWLLRAAPNIFFTSVKVARPNQNELAVVPIEETSTLSRLRFTDECDSACELRALPQFAFNTAALRGLEMTAPYRHHDAFHGHALISYAAHTLERLGLRIDGHYPPTLQPLPLLPALRFLEFKYALPVFARGVKWFVQSLPIFLAASPALAQLIVTLHPISIPADPLPHEFTVKVDLLTVLDDALDAHPGSPSLTWRFQWQWRGDARPDVDDPIFGTFAELVRRRMPKMLRVERLVFTEYVAPGPGASIADGPQWGDVTLINDT